MISPASGSCACFRAPCDCPALGENNQDRSNVIPFPQSSVSSAGFPFTTTVLLIGGLALAWYAYRKFFKS